jgi:tetratricopeptide (TPR) repeat protein
MPATATLERPTGLTLDQSVTLDELVTMVGYAERLAFFFARCNAPVLRDRLIDQATQRLAGRGMQVVVASLPPNTANVRPYLRQQLDRARCNGARDGRRVALFVTDLEHSLPFDRPDAPVLTELNMGRELFHRDAPVPIVFWLPDYALTILARSAPDFWAWRSGVFDFALDPLYRQQTFQQYALRDSDWLSVDNMTVAQKHQRRRILEGLLDEYGRSGDTSGVHGERTELLFRLAQINQALHDLPRAIGYYQQYLSSVRSQGDRHAESVALGNLGIAYGSLGDARRAIEYYEQALTISRQMGERQGEGSSLGNLGSAYLNLGDPRQAIEYYEQALAISREIGDRRSEGNRLGNLGLAYADLGDTRRAIQCYEQALVISREIGDRRGEGTGLGNLGLAHADLGDARRAIEYYEQALVISREIGDQRSEGTVLGNVGKMYADLGEFWRAIEYFERALAISHEIGDRRGEARHLVNLGAAHALANDLREARRLWQDALSILLNIESPYAATVRGWLAQLSD